MALGGAYAQAGRSQSKFGASQPAREAVGVPEGLPETKADRAGESAASL